MNNNRISPWVFAGLDVDRANLVCKFSLKYLNTNLQELQSRSRVVSQKENRKKFFYLMRKYGKLELKQIGNLVGYCHSNVLHHIQDFEEKLSIKDKEYLKIVEDFNSIFGDE